MRLLYMPLLFLFVFLPLTSPNANTLVAKIDGMVCAFCTVGLEEQIKKDPNVDTVNISMDDQTVTVTSKPENIVLPKTIEKAVYYMGFTLKDLKDQK